MVVAQINALYGTKSTGIIVKDIHESLIKNGHKSYVFNADYGDNESVFRIGNSFDHKFHALLTRIFGRQGFYSKLSTKKLIKQLNILGVDIIHLHNVHSNFININILMQHAKNNGIPVVLTLHDCWYFTGKCFHFCDIGCEKWRHICKHCPKRFKDIPSYLVDSSKIVFDMKKIAFNYQDMYVVGCSKWISDLSACSPIFTQHKKTYIYNGVDKDIFKPNSESIKPHIQIMVMANKWFAESNKDLVREIIALSPNEYKYVIVGCNKEQLSSFVGDNVTMLGYIKSREKLADLYRSSTLFLNLTDADTLPTVNMESLSCGTPVITTNVGGSPELIAHGKTGYILKNKEANEILEYIRKIVSGDISRNDCSDYAIDHFDKNKNYLKYIEIYSELLRGKCNGRKSKI